MVVTTPSNNNYYYCCSNPVVEFVSIAVRTVVIFLIILAVVTIDISY